MKFSSLRLFNNNALVKLLLLVLVAAQVSCNAQSDWTETTVCTETETRGIDQCASAGESFFLDQAKAERCPQTYTSVSNWTCDDWKCHVYCTNPSRPDERKSCTTCPEIDVTGDCWDERRETCRLYVTSNEDCDVDCSGVVPTTTMMTFSLVVLVVVGMLW
mmetsp:Transcript_14035/g.20747  ORF Transcript_14035/g.20747 Transcript_14035/m.20747 type:complete len:161 (+) Transcript_14035:149-631(+)|eukprot:CAMPEP_0194224648 /NCGR_PEP_ID=MMETSP0156-20130528/37977_1 /TAXON_ID=33649 /ORGANISM="Thalassionema nitzschioides, Strain L26-B" /LENGTH=160 /DNA_ID=CAMNT_0038956317 /DNA_START=104 /DNA_END=586 /DNA_ORIENTATION=-